MKSARWRDWAERWSALGTSRRSNGCGCHFGGGGVVFRVCIREREKERGISFMSDIWLSLLLVSHILFWSSLSTLLDLEVLVWREGKGMKCHTRAMFVSRNLLFKKSFSKLFCVCLLLEKLVNRKYFPVNGKHFPVKEKFGLVFRKMFFFLAVFVFWKVVSGKSLSKLSYVCLSLEKLVNEKHLPVKEKFGLVFRKVFSWKIWTENTFRKLWKI